MRKLTKYGGLLLLLLLVLSNAGCGTFMARSIVRSPNRYPSWFAPNPTVTLAFNPKLLTNFAAQFVEVGPPPAKLCYRVVKPADYQFKVSSTNWLQDGELVYEFHFKASMPAQTNCWSSSPRGTVILLHGYGLAQFSMLSWALRLAEDGWQCVLVDLRGHGKSTGKRIYFGTKETTDLSQLLDQLAGDKLLDEPVSVMGESYGAALALRWKTVDPRVDRVIAIAPYAGLSNAVMNIRQEYAGWVPKYWVRSGIRKLPSVLNVPADELDTTTVLKRKPVAALLIAGGHDKIVPEAEIEKLHQLMLPDSEFIKVPEATHETLTYFMDDLTGPITAWLEHSGDISSSVRTNETVKKTGKE